MVLIFADAHPFGSVTAEPITVDIVSSDEATPPPRKEEPPKPQPSEAFDVSSRETTSRPPEPVAEPQQQTAPSTPPPVKQQAARAQPPPTSPVPAFVPPEPDLSIKYQVMLGLPPALPQESPKVKSGNDFDAAASKAADIDSGFVTEFRRHLKSCSKLPGSIAPSDKLRITLRVRMTPEGKLAAEPILIEATASPKGPDLMQSAIAALGACQPYAMLPADKYREWQVLDLSFTPLDF